MTVGKKLGTFIAAAAVTAFVSTSVMAASVAGTYKRKNTTATVSVCKNGGLTASSAGTRMFTCAKKVGKNTWKSSKMKHPDMFAIMTFNGTIKRSGNKLSVQGCMVGGSMCDAETWTKK